MLARNHSTVLQATIWSASMLCHAFWFQASVKMMALISLSSTWEEHPANVTAVCSISEVPF